MNREQMIELARDEISAWDNECGCPISGDLAESIGKSVLDAILPQVSTVAELEALPSGTRVMDSLGYVVFADTPAAISVVGRGFPVTVVWQPEATS